MCPMNDGIEKTDHVLLLCPALEIQCRIIPPFVQINSLSNNILVEILLYGDKDFSDDVNKTILELTRVFFGL